MARPLTRLLPRVVIIGAGFGGLRVARGLRAVQADVTLIDAHNFHTFQPLLYQVATAGLGVDDICFPVRAILRRQPTAGFLLGRVTSVDLGSRTVTVADEHVVAYDYLVVAAGTISSTFGIEGVSEHTYPLKMIEDAVAVRNHLLTRFEEASSQPASDVDLGIVIVGGGPTGVEMAGALRELLDWVLHKDYPQLDLARVTVTLVEGAERVLGPFHPSLSASTERTLRRRGVRVETGVGVRRVRPGTVVLQDGRELAAGTIVWAAGVTASPVASLLGIDLTRNGRIPVGDDLSLADHPEVFAIGDIAASPTADGRPLPQVAQPAIQGGKHVAAQIAARIDGRPSAPFRYKDKGSMATIGRNQAVTEFPNGLKLRGFIGWLSWLGLHIVYLIGFRNRANVLVNWAWNYLTYDRGSRLIVEPTSRNTP